MRFLLDLGDFDDFSIFLVNKVHSELLTTMRGYQVRRRAARSFASRVGAFDPRERQIQPSEGVQIFDSRFSGNIDPIFFFEAFDAVVY
jgi:hypothetical protein